MELRVKKKGSHQSIFCLYVYACSGHVMRIEAYHA